MPEAPPVAHAPGAHLAAGAKEVVREVLELVSRGGIDVLGRLRDARPRGSPPRPGRSGRRTATRSGAPGGRPRSRRGRGCRGRRGSPRRRPPARCAPASGGPGGHRLSARCRTNGSSSRKSPSAASDAPTPAPGLRSSHVRSKPQPALATARLVWAERPSGASTATSRRPPASSHSSACSRSGRLASGSSGGGASSPRTKERLPGAEDGRWAWARITAFDAFTLQQRAGGAQSAGRPAEIRTRSRLGGGVAPRSAAPS